MRSICFAVQLCSCKLRKHGGCATSAGAQPPGRPEMPRGEPPCRCASSSFRPARKAGTAPTSGTCAPPPNTQSCGYHARCMAKQDLSSLRAGPAGAFSCRHGASAFPGPHSALVVARPLGEAGSSLYEPAGLGSPPVWPVNNIPLSSHRTLVRIPGPPPLWACTTAPTERGYILTLICAIIKSVGSYQPSRKSGRACTFQRHRQTAVISPEDAQDGGQREERTAGTSALAWPAALRMG